MVDLVYEAVNTVRYVWRVVTATLLLLALLGATTTVWARNDVNALAQAEREHIEAQGFTLPQHAVLVMGYTDTFGVALYSSRPVSYFVLLRPWYYRDALASAVIAHEFAHLLQWQARVVFEDNADTEAQADVFAACFGTPGAQDWARRVWAANPTAEQCASIKLTLAKRGPTP